MGFMSTVQYLLQSIIPLLQVYHFIFCQRINLAVKSVVIATHYLIDVMQLY